MFKKIEINIPFSEAMTQMPLYAKFMKKILSRKRKIVEEGIVTLTTTCSAVIQNSLPEKMQDSGNFTIPYEIGHADMGKAVCDSRASINLMPLFVAKRLSLGELNPTAMTLQMADRTLAHHKGILEDVLIKVGKFIFPVDIVVIDIEEDKQVPLLLGRPFLATGAALIDVKKEELTLKVGDEAVHFNLNHSLKQPELSDVNCEILETKIPISYELNNDCILHNSMNENEMNFQYLEHLEVEFLDSNVKLKKAVLSVEENNTEKSSSDEEEASNINKSSKGLILKELPEHLEHAFLQPEKGKPVIISTGLTGLEKQKLLEILIKYKEAIAWSIEDLKGISPSICMHKILLEENVKTSIEHQRRLNPVMKEVVRKEVLKWLNASFIYAISDNPWVSPVHVVPKKGGFTMIRNKNNELIPIRTVTGWKVCISYRKLNTYTRKDHYPLPFIDQMLDRLAGHSHYCFLDGYSSYNWIAIALEDQEKTTFTCPYGTFAFRRMPFGLCDAPATFQRCMMSMFSDLVEEVMEIFMDDFLVYGSCFENCLENLETVLQRCQDKKSSSKLGEIPFYGNKRYCLGTQNLCYWIGSRPRKSCCYKNSYATYNSKGDKKLPWTCWFLQKIYKGLLKNLQTIM